MKAQPLTQPKRYRWLEVDAFYTYGPRLGKGLDERRGARCKVLTVPRGGAKPGNVRVVFDDGYVAIVPAGTLRLPKIEGVCAGQA